MNSEIFHEKKPKVLLVTGAEATYFPLMLELIQSIRKHPAGRETPIGIIDAGMTEEQIKILQHKNCLVRHFEPSSFRIQKAVKSRRALAVNLGKLWLDKIFPDYDLFVFLDADTWIQSWEAMDQLIGAASEGSLAIVGTWNRYRDSLPVHWYWGFIPVFRSFNLKAAYRAGLPLGVIKKMSRYPDLNAGVYALKRDTPHWDRMRKWQDIVLKKGRPFTSDGLAMALTCCIDQMPSQRLSAACNYTLHRRPLYDEFEKRFVDPFYPHHPIGIMHLTGHKTIRSNLEETLEFESVLGRNYQINPRYNDRKYQTL